MKLLLDDADMDAQLGRTLVAIAAEAADIGEALATARRTVAGDYDSWFREWAATATVAKSLGDDAMRRGDVVTSRKAYLRASEYWRQSFFFIRHNVDGERLQHAWREHQAAFRAALPLLGWHSVAAEIPFDGVSMTGYLLRPADDGLPRPTVLAPAVSTQRRKPATAPPATWPCRAATTSSCSKARARVACCSSITRPFDRTSRCPSAPRSSGCWISPVCTRAPWRSSAGRSPATWAHARRPPNPGWLR